jgi:GNAT superfamily N-acetyltransferase
VARHLSIELLADHPQHVETLARWHCEEDGRGDDGAWLDFWRRQLRAECGRDRIPIAFVALSPWLAGTLVHPGRRGEGIGTALVEHAVSRAAELGVTTLYLYSERARGLYERLGWSHLRDEFYEGEPVAVLSIAPPRRAGA